jgi:putative PIN family toxin of toxin-antitoxin system
MGSQASCQTVIIVLDSSAWVSALVFGGVPGQALIEAQTVDAMLTCTQLEDEVVRIMCEKFGDSPEKVRKRMRAFLKDSTRVIVTGRLAGICRDPKDDFILECAETGNADLIVTGDKDLLSLGRFGATEILTPRQYLDRAGDRPRRG